MTDDSGSLGASAEPTGLSPEVEPRTASQSLRDFDPSREGLGAYIGLTSAANRKYPDAAEVAGGSFKFLPINKPFDSKAIEASSTVIERDLLSELATYLSSIRVFLTSKQRPHEAGLQWHDELTAKVVAAAARSACDSDGSLAEDAQRLSGEAVPARAEGIAQPTSETPHDS